MSDQNGWGGHGAIYLGPPPAVHGNMAQVFARQGGVLLLGTANMALRALFPAQPPIFNLQWGVSGGLFAVFWNNEDIASVHGTISWVDDTLVYFVRVLPLQIDDETMPLIVPIIQIP